LVEAKMRRRKFLEFLGAAALTPYLASSQEAKGMWGLISKITVLPGKLDDMIALLTESTVGMPGCLGYVVAKDATDENAIWVTEVWDSKASLSILACREECHAPRQGDGFEF
jgi:hypothetical protein